MSQAAEHFYWPLYENPPFLPENWDEVNTATQESFDQVFGEKNDE